MPTTPTVQQKRTHIHQLYNTLTRNKTAIHLHLQHPCCRADCTHTWMWLASSFASTCTWVQRPKAYIRVLYYKTLVWNYILISSSNILMENIANVGIHNSKMQPNPSQFYLCQIVVKSINVNTFDSLLFSVLSLDVELCMFVQWHALRAIIERRFLCACQAVSVMWGALSVMWGVGETHCWMCTSDYYEQLVRCSDYEWRLPRSRWLCHK